VKINLTRQLKNKKIKQEVNITCHYRGINFDISDLSDGEIDRVNFAMTISLNVICGCPILMLDESFQSLDGDKNKFPTIMRKYLCNDGLVDNDLIGGKLVMCIDHGAVEGHYDHVINL
jgi:ABC-type Mn2+/Zn2+ transport system ATPase subunit